MRRLKVQLIGLLVLAVLLPAVPIALTTHSLISRSLDPLLGDDLQAGARAGLEAVRESLDREKDQFLEAVLVGEATDRLTPENLAALDAREREALEARARAAIEAMSGEDGASSKTGATPELVEPEPKPDQPGTLIPPDHLRVIIPPERVSLAGRDALVALVVPHRGEPIWLTRALPPELAERAARLTASVQLVESLRRQREPVVKSLIATFLVVYGLVVVLVLALGLYFASRITRPMTALSRGVDRVSSRDRTAQCASAS